MNGEDRVDKIRDEAFADMERKRLPGWEAFLASNEKARIHIEEQEGRIAEACRDNDEVRLERALAGWRKAWFRVNEVVAEEYRLANKDPYQWEWRYFKWMSKVTYMRCDSPMGEFYVFPRKPRRKPKVEHWFTADEMLDMMHPATAKAIELFGQLPVRPDSLEGPRQGEKHMEIDLTGEEMKVRYILPKRS